jgi:transcriptional regulator with XRE-family HTH domain
MAESANVTFQQAARELRSHLHHSQQYMATFLGLSMAALRNYESGASIAPDARAAAAYLLAADMTERSDLVEVFRSELYRALGIQEPIWKQTEVAAEGEGSSRQDIEHEKAISPLRILAEMGELRTHPMAKTLFLEPVDDHETRLIRTLLACIRGQGPFKKYREPILQALVRPWLLIDIDDPDLDLLLLKKEELSDQRLAFLKALTHLQATLRSDREADQG